MNTINRAYRFELDLNDRQRTMVNRACGLSRKVFNWGLAERQRQYEEIIKPARERGEKIKSLTHFDQCKLWVAGRAQIAPWASEFTSSIHEHALLDVDRAYKAFFAGLKQSGHHAGFPRFKKRGQHDSFRVRGAIKVENNTVALPRMARLRIKGNTCRVSGEIKSATLSRRADRWFVSILVEQSHAVAAATGPVIGIDAGLKMALTLSDGRTYEAPKPLKISLRKLRRANKALARSQRNSAGHARAAARVAKVHLLVSNQRGNWLHGVSDQITRTAGTVVVEDLAVANLQNKKRHQGRSWADLGIGELYRQLEYKSAWRGVGFIKADRFYPSSQLCSSCGARQPMPLNIRVYDCPACGLSLDRDLNAAINLASLAGMPPESLNARGGGVSLGSAERQPMKREPSSDCVACAT